MERWKHAADYRQHAVRLKWRAGERRMKLGNLLPAKLVGLSGAYSRLHRAVENVPIKGSRSAFALRFDVFRHESVG